MWKKALVITIMLYIFALLQSAFFSHFSFFGVIPNLVFILFFISIFFENDKDHNYNNYLIVFWAVAAGFFLDAMSSPYFGPSIILLVIIGFSIKKAQSSLKNIEDGHPFAYFLPLFLFFFIVYSLLQETCLSFLEIHKIVFYFNFGVIFLLIYNLAAASLLFYIYKWQKFIE